MSALFLATVEATEEAVLNSLLKATTVVGRDGNTRDAIDIKELLQVLKKYNALDWDKKLPPWGNGQKKPKKKQEDVRQRRLVRLNTRLRMPGLSPISIPAQEWTVLGPK
jgi:hypothetical protein